MSCEWSQHKPSSQLALSDGDGSPRLHHAQMRAEEGWRVETWVWVATRVWEEDFEGEGSLGEVLKRAHCSQREPRAPAVQLDFAHE